MDVAFNTWTFCATDSHTGWVFLLILPCAQAGGYAFV